MNQNMVEVKNVTKRFNDKLVLDNISLDIKKGEIFGLIGPNGAGKSTLINIITGLIKADSGQVTIGGDDIDKDPVACKRRIGLVPQSLAIIKEFNAYDNLEYFGAFYGLSGKLLKERIEEALEVTGLKDRRKEKVKQFSGGMLRRLNLGASIMHHPELLILDEPTVGVDAQSRNYTFDYLRQINKDRETTILYTSHYMEEVESLCNRIFIMDLGKEIAYGSKNEVLRLNSRHDALELSFQDDSQDRTSYLSTLPGIRNLTREEGQYRLLVEPDFKLESLVSKLAQDGHSISGLKLDQPNLEEVFLALTGKTLRD